ncbi:YitT family protein [Coprobacillus sp. OF03-2AA]|nr:YitT family protein [Coprobacillus sp. OF03-2AA]
MAATTKTFVRPAHLLSGGFMGIALLVDMIADLFGKSIPTAFTLVALNVPVALICAKKISKRFVFFSLLQVFLTSFLLQIIPNYPLFDEQVLNVVFGGYIWGMSIVLALKAGASSGGTDFIALYFANKNGREIWMQVFVFNAMILCIFGCIFGFDKAGYSILFQFISTKTISTFHTRYKRVMLHIYTSKKDEVVNTYLEKFHHGITALDGYGGYSHHPVSYLTAVVSSYEVGDVLEALKETDPKIIVSVTKVENFIGRFYNKPLD